jgi:hypothetical protein
VQDGYWTQKISITPTASDYPGGSGATVSWRYRQVGQGWIDWQTAGTITVPHDGAYEIQVKSVDKAGNETDSPDFFLGQDSNYTVPADVDYLPAPSIYGGRGMDVASDRSGFGYEMPDTQLPIDGSQAQMSSDGGQTWVDVPQDFLTLDSAGDYVFRARVHSVELGIGFWSDWSDLSIRSVTVLRPAS